MAKRSPEPSPYIDFGRDEWRELRRNTPQVLTAEEVEKLRGIGDMIDLEEVADVYLPLSRLIYLQAKARQKLTDATADFLGTPTFRVPFIIGIGGSVAVGKSTTARVLHVLLQRWSSTPRVDLVTTDGFLYPSAELERRGLMNRKGFPDSYDQRALLRFVTDVKSGKEDVMAPVYSHLKYDRLPDVYTHVKKPDILILEGLNVLQTGPTLMVSDLFDFSVFVDAAAEDIERWYINRFLALRSTVFTEPDAHFAHYSHLSEERAQAEAREIWQSINLPNLVENILPTRVRASLVLRKGPDHRVQRVRMRKH